MIRILLTCAVFLTIVCQGRGRLEPNRRLAYIQYASPVHSTYSETDQRSKVYISLSDGVSEQTDSKQNGYFRGTKIDRNFQAFGAFWLYSVGIGTDRRDLRVCEPKNGTPWAGALGSQYLDTSCGSDTDQQISFGYLSPVRTNDMPAALVACKREVLGRPDLRPIFSYTMADASPMSAEAKWVVNMNTPCGPAHQVYHYDDAPDIAYQVTAKVLGWVRPLGMGTGALPPLPGSVILPIFIDPL